MKNSFKYIFMIIVFIAFVASITVSILSTKYSVQGVFNLSRKKFDVVFSNVMVDKDNIKVKLDNTNKSIHVEIDNLSNKEEISLDIKNIANIDAIIKNYSISNVMTNGESNNINVNVSLENGVVIKKGESKKLIITINNNSKAKDLYYNFNINYLFEEDNL